MKLVFSNAPEVVAVWGVQSWSHQKKRFGLSRTSMLRWGSMEEVFFSSPGHNFCYRCCLHVTGVTNVWGIRKTPRFCLKRCTKHRLGFRGEGHHCISLGATLRCVSKVSGSQQNSLCNTSRKSLAMNAGPRNFRKIQEGWKENLPWVYQHLHSANLGFNRTWMEDVLKD